MLYTTDRKAAEEQLRRTAEFRERFLGIPHIYLCYVAPSPDGRFLAWSGIEVDNDAWLVELDGP
ncbi:MAG TPA: hypothetical protein VFZ09_36105 [Archangium sp.]|uniref:hypothetical protein n=1 Tax=Archangium sp. TaxID=1872627 RepID=UPI002E33DFC1|nr:hypothetical protein [Archangium sp.]HEX5751700.1 hypothetical protein [Archangium sp.]